MRFLTVILMFLALVRPANAQETRIAPEDHTPSAASVADMAWLAGQWRGTGIEGAAAYESWLPANGGTMVGTFVQETAEGGIMFTEHLYLMEDEGSLVLRLKHFNADLTGWEEKDDMTSFRLVAMEPGAAFFHGLTLRKDGDDGFVAAVRMRQKDGSSSELVFRFTRI
ncbi:DUF6265 family protein [Altererythrobacter sp. ZODW24]|uniref:DUF6265 family protein n=1 Tax=Altererythrobacter sp. ZODW24 TaxID=2185142 RepID=UPI000DF7AC81|nr:DUF6265 family protein [Altererythrobacter sp. ZODW24]